MNANVDRMLDAFQDYYTTGTGTLVYNQAQRRALHDELDGFTRDYLRVVYDEVLVTHESKWRSLPDVALLRKVMARLDAPETYRRQTPHLHLTDDAGWTDEEMDRALQKFREAAGRLATTKNINKVAP